MTCPHDAQHDLWLQALLSGVRGAEQRVAELERCPSCCRRLAGSAATAAALDAAGREQRAVLADTAAARDDDAELVRRALAAGGVGARRPVIRPWLLAAAAVVLVATGIGVAMWPGLSPQDGPADVLLGLGEAWPADENVTVQKLAARGFVWAGHPDETYRLLLFQPSDPLEPWQTLRGDGPRATVDGALAERMRAVSRSWRWHYERTSPPLPGSPSVAVSESYRFSFAR